MDEIRLEIGKVDLPSRRSKVKEISGGERSLLQRLIKKSNRADIKGEAREGSYSGRMGRARGTRSTRWRDPPVVMKRKH